MAPTLKTVTDALRSEAHMWDRQAETMTSLHGTIEGLRMSRLQAGIFQIFFSAYENAVNQLSSRCEEGGARMGEIADALVRNATAYDNREADTTASIEGAY
ncbi:type VII secretion target [Streptomyces sp. NPDC014733]|uniref:type VII secretion target n=1 Tax=Streptomyces sp. NPDC014733 TaxID=3364885 RepID=UPI0036FD6DFA